MLVALIALLMQNVAPVNLARTAVATASESQEGLTPGLAIDGTQLSRWSGIPGHNEGVWFQLDWAEKQAVSEVIVHQYDRYTTGMRLELFDGDDWKPIQTLRVSDGRLPKTLLFQFSPTSVRRLRLADISNGPSFTEIEVYAQRTVQPLQITAASDLQGNLIGMATDGLGIMPKNRMEVGVEINGRKSQVKTDENGLFTLPLPLDVKTVRLGETVMDRADIQMGLTPWPIVKHSPKLDGQWRFMPDPPAEFQSPTFDDSRWKTIKVPAHWEMEGFRSLPGVGGYRIRFQCLKLPARRELLRFEGVYSYAEVYVNGKLITRHEGGATPFEADMTDVVHDGENLLALLVREHTVTSDHLDKMSQYADFPLAGIFRSVRVFSVPETRIGSVHVRTEFDSTYRSAKLVGNAVVWNQRTAHLVGSNVHLSLSDPAGKSVADLSIPCQQVQAWQRQSVPFEIPISRPVPWNAEKPELYTLHISLVQKGATLQEFDQPVGLRQTEIRGSQVLINGTPAKFYGTCHHDSHPTMGRAVTEELTRQDLQMMKEANLNAVRTSHYPSIPELPEIADDLGLYVEDEASFCWADASNDLRNVPRIVQLEAELLERDRNHPSVFMWSLCNESEFGFGFERAHEFVRKMDPSRPTGAATSAWLEIATLHNPLSIQRIRENESIDRPLFFDESLCIYQGIWGDAAEMWVDPGIRDYYVEPLIPVMEEFRKSKATQGTFIWCWADDLFLLPGRGSEFGRGMAESHFVQSSYAKVGYGIVGDAPWGVVDGWRRRKPEFFHIQRLYCPIRVDAKQLRLPSNTLELHIPVRNEYDFTNFSELKIHWTLGGQSGVISSDLAPHASGELVITLKERPLDNILLNVEFSRGDTVVCTESLPVIVQVPGREQTVTGGWRPWRPLASPTASADSTSALRTMEESTLAGTAIRYVSKDLDYLVDRSTGRLRRFVAFGHPVLLDLPMPHVLISGQPLTPSPDPKSWRLRDLRSEDGRVRITGEVDGFSGTIDLVFSTLGDVHVTADYTYHGPEVKAREIGLALSMPREYQSIAWVRNAEWSNYPNDHIGAPFGEAEAFPTPIGDVIARPWSLDASPMGCSLFRSTKRNVDWVAMSGGGATMTASGMRHARAMIASDRTMLYLLDWYGGTGAGLWEWTSNYGEGKSLKPGDKLNMQINLQLSR